MSRIKRIDSNYDKVKNETQRQHVLGIAWLMASKSDAIRLVLENLVLSYDYESVRNELDNLNIKIKKAG